MSYIFIGLLGLTIVTLGIVIWAGLILYEVYRWATRQEGTW